MDRFQILCLAGGGYRGLYSASVLSHLENHFQKPVHECFDLICGTSIGGVIATGLAYHVTAQAIRESLLTNGKKIFSNKGRGILRPFYGADNLRKSIEKILPENAKIGDAYVPYITTAVNVQTGSPRTFKTPHLSQYVADRLYPAVSTALATSAAPFYFPPARVGTDDFVDGGLFANAPDLIGMHEAEYFLGVPRERIHILSIGTTGKIAGLGHNNNNKWGAWDWVKKDKLIMELTFSAQQKFAENIAQHCLQERYFKIDESHSGDDSFTSGLDNASDNAVKNLESLANTSFMRAVNNDRLKEFFNHIPNRTNLQYNFIEESAVA